MHLLPDHLHDLWYSAAKKPANNNDRGLDAPLADGVFLNEEKAALTELLHGLDIAQMTGPLFRATRLFTHPGRDTLREAHEERVFAARTTVLQELVALDYIRTAVFLSTQSDWGCPSFAMIVAEALARHGLRSRALRLVNQWFAENCVEELIEARLRILAASPTKASERFLRQCIERLVAENPAEALVNANNWLNLWKVTRDKRDLDEALAQIKEWGDPLDRFQLYRAAALLSGKMNLFRLAFQTIRTDRRKQAIYAVAQLLECICICTQARPSPTPVEWSSAFAPLAPWKYGYLVQMLQNLQPSWAQELRRRLVRDGVDPRVLTPRR